VTDHGNAISAGKILYGENSFGSTHASAILPAHNGANVWIKALPSACPFYGDVAGHGCWGRNELGVSTVDDLAACEALCDADCQCIAYEFKASTRKCQLSSSCTEEINDSTDSSWAVYFKDRSCWC